MTTYALPLFPLSLVLLPGTTQRLHIFEPRYRQMLHDCTEGEPSFGLLYAPPANHGSDPQPGDVGCRAHIQSQERLADGRSNIVVSGQQRFYVQSLRSTDKLYVVGLVDEFDDTPGDRVVMASLMERIGRRYAKLLAALGSKTVHSEVLGGLPSDPTAFAFAILGTLDTDLAVQETMLRLVSPEKRLRHLDALLGTVAIEVAQRDVLRRRARGNGHGDRPHSVTSDS